MSSFWYLVILPEVIGISDAGCRLMSGLLTKAGKVTFARACSTIFVYLPIPTFGIQSVIVNYLLILYYNTINNCSEWT